MRKIAAECFLSFILEIQNRGKKEKILTPFPHSISAGIQCGKGRGVIYKSGRGSPY